MHVTMLEVMGWPCQSNQISTVQCAMCIRRPTTQRRIGSRCDAHPYDDIEFKYVVKCCKKQLIRWWLFAVRQDFATRTIFRLRFLLISSEFVYLVRAQHAAADTCNKIHGVKMYDVSANTAGRTTSMPPKTTRARRMARMGTDENTRSKELEVISLKLCRRNFFFSGGCSALAAVAIQKWFVHPRRFNWFISKIQRDLFSSVFASKRTKAKNFLRR